MPVKVKATGQQQAPRAPSDGNGKARPIGGLRKEPDPEYGKLLNVSKQAPGTMIIMGGLGLIGWFLAGAAQMLTTIDAFVLDTIHGNIYKNMSSAQQGQALPIIILACIVLAILIQIFVNIAAWRIELSWKHGVSLAGEEAKRRTKWRSGAVEVTHQPGLILLFGAIFFVANGLGDYGFSYSFTDSPIFLFFWGTILAVCGTILLPESTQLIWSGLSARAEQANDNGNKQTA